METLVPISLDKIWVDDDFNARDHITPASVASLADDIFRNGLFQNPVVQKLMPGINDGRPTSAEFKCVMGHRRIEAYKLNRRGYPNDARWAEIHCKVKEPLLDSEARIMNLKENMERRELNMLEEARGIAPFKKDGWSPLKVAKELGTTKQWVEIRFGLLALPEEIQRRAAAGYLNQYQIAECIRKSTRDDQINYVRAIVDHKERGLKITGKEVKKRVGISVMTKGTPRTIMELAAVQESIQSSFGNLRHPAAMALGFAMGVISYDEFIADHVNKWAEEDGVEFKHHEMLTKDEVKKAE